MSTKTLIDRILPHASGWARTGTRSILQLIQDAQDELMDYDAPSMRFLDDSNEGFPPYLKTVTGTQKYAVTTANLSTTLQKSLGGVNYDIRCRKVIRIFLDVTESENFVYRWIGEPYVHSYMNPYSVRSTRRVQVADMPFDTILPTETEALQVVFKEDPGTTTDKFFIEFTWEPPRLTSESIPLIVPAQYHQAIIEYCIGQVQMFANGKYNEFQNRFEAYWKPKFKADTSYFRGSNNLQVEPLIC
jgi:hypothetical protein